MRPPDNATSLPCEHFEGPLDLLLDEVRRQNVRIENIAMAPIVARFLGYVETAASRNLNLDIDWLHMAAILIHWKSQSLLPREPALRSGPDVIRDRLVQQLLAHGRQAVEELDRRRSGAQDRLSRSVSEMLVEESDDEPGESAGLSVWDMVQQSRELAAWVVKHREEQRQWRELRVEQDDVTVAEMMDYLHMQLSTRKDESMDAVKLLREESSSSRRAVLFLGMLEMAKDQIVRLDQKEAFGPLWLSLG